PSPRRQSPRERGQITRFLMRRRPPRFDPGSLEPLIALGRFAAPRLAAGFVLAGAQGSPTPQISIGWKWIHLRTDLGQDLFGAPPPDSADRVESFQLRLGGRHPLFDSPAGGLDLLIPPAHLFQQPPEHPSLILVEPPVERLDQVLALGAESPFRQRRQPGRIALPFAPRPAPRPAAPPQNVGRHIREL